jgi:hypothetical protein
MDTGPAAGSEATSEGPEGPPGQLSSGGSRGEEPNAEHPALPGPVTHNCGPDTPPSVAFGPLNTTVFAGQPVILHGWCDPGEHNYWNAADNGCDSRALVIYASVKVILDDGQQTNATNLDSAWGSWSATVTFLQGGVHTATARAATTRGPTYSATLSVQVTGYCGPDAQPSVGFNPVNVVTAGQPVALTGWSDPGEHNYWNVADNACDSTALVIYTGVTVVLDDGQQTTATNLDSQWGSWSATVTFKQAGLRTATAYAKTTQGQTYSAAISVQVAGPASPDVALFAVASDGSVNQWDGLAPPTGIMLRWFHSPDVGFPDFGYDIYRASRQQVLPITFDPATAASMAGRTHFPLRPDLMLNSPTPFRFQSLPGGSLALNVSSAGPLTLTLPSAAWYLQLTAASVGSSMQVTIYAGGQPRGTAVLPPGAAAEWRTRGIGTAVVTGNGAILSIAYDLAEAPMEWALVKHLCLPVSNPAYACGPQPAGSEEAEAQSRVPLAVQAVWASRYHGFFVEAEPVLQALAVHGAPPPLGPASAGTPALGASSFDMFDVALTDPHVARIAGLAWDDPLADNRLDGATYAYKVVGTWQWAHQIDLTALGEDAWGTLQAQGVNVSGQNVVYTLGADGLYVRLDGFASDGNVTFYFTNLVSDLTVSVGSSYPAPFSWQARDDNGNPIAELRWVPPGPLVINVTGIRSLVLSGFQWIRLLSIGWGPSEYQLQSLLPGVIARDPGPPAGPGWVKATVAQPGGTAGPLHASLDWDIAADAQGAYQDAATVCYQIAATQTGADPQQPAPPPPAFDPSYLLAGGAVVIVPPNLAGAAPPRQLYLDSGDATGSLREGWRSWWARGVDLFGRVSLPSPPDSEQIEDSAAPPPPTLVLTEYAQGDLPAGAATLTGRSATGQEWLASHPGQSAVVVGWAWTPELDEQCRDTDGFRIYLRRPQPVTNPGPGDPQVTYDNVPWGNPVDQIGPIATHLDGTVTAITAGITAAVTVTMVTPLDPGHALCHTDLALDAGSGALAGAQLAQGRTSFDITGNGQGSGISIIVALNSGAAPMAGGCALTQLPADIVTISTTIQATALTGDPYRKRTSGALTSSSARLLVLSSTASGDFICAGYDPTQPAPAVGDPVSWYPAYIFAIQDTGFGPSPSPSSPVAQAQVTVTSVRRWATRSIESGPGAPGAVTGVESTPPATPSLDTIATGPYCAEIGTRADWYGVSRITIGWNADPTLGYIVYRALGDAIWRLDLAYHTSGAAPQPHRPSYIPPAIAGDASRMAVVTGDLTTLDTAIAASFGQPNFRDLAVPAYEALHTDAQQVLAAQDYAAYAFAGVTGEPLTAADVPFVDQVNGKSRGHWFYKVAAVSPAGVRCDPTDPTPPICCPDVAPPAVPSLVKALADNGQVLVQWLASGDPDMALYRLYRAPDEASASDVGLMDDVAEIAPSPSSTGALALPGPVLDRDGTPKPGWLQFACTSPPGTWFFRMVAEDQAGNRSAQSNVLSGRSLKPLPAKPVVISAVRNGSPPTTVTVTWQYGADSRLSAALERRPAGGGLWVQASQWLPRGVTACDDDPPDLNASWGYRVRVRDTLGMVALSDPYTLM